MWARCSSRRSRLQDDIEYREKMGRLLAHRVGKIFSEFGYNTWICPRQGNGVDLIVRDRNFRKIIVGEILNWGPTSNLDIVQLGQIIENLTKYDCNRVLIYTQMGNEGILECLGQEGITTIKIGFQILAEYFYRKLEPHQIKGRRIDSRETRLLIASKLVEYIQYVEMNPLTE